MMNYINIIKITVLKYVNKSILTIIVSYVWLALGTYFQASYLCVTLKLRILVIYYKIAPVTFVTPCSRQVSDTDMTVLSSLWPSFANLSSQSFFNLGLIRNYPVVLGSSNIVTQYIPVRWLLIGLLRVLPKYLFNNPHYYQTCFYLHLCRRTVLLPLVFSLLS